jgi:hypothetical protein
MRTIMPRRHAPLLAAPVALALIATPALAQTQGAPSTADTTPRAVPGTGGAAAVPGTGQTSNDRGPTNDPNAGRSGAGGRMPFSTGPMQGGGGPLGQHSRSPQ